MTSVGRNASVLLAAVYFLGAASGSRAQSMEPLSYTNAPIGLNFLLAGYGYLWGGVLVDPSLPVKDVNAKISTAGLTYTRVLDIAGQSGMLTLVAPYAWLSAKGEVDGQSKTAKRSGLADLALRLSVNLYGAPALSLRQFRDYRQDTIFGVSLMVTAPTGKYDPARLINLGTNRWSFRPEAGISKALGPWTLEAAASVTFFTDNNDFLNGNVREQEPLYSVQGHVIYNFSSALWAALDANFYTGGRTSVNGTLDHDRQQNSRWGATLARAFDRNNSVKLYFSSGVSARSGSDFNALGLAWQYRWGAGL